MRSASPSPGPTTQLSSQPRRASNPSSSYQSGKAAVSTQGSGKTSASPQRTGRAGRSSPGHRARFDEDSRVIKPGFTPQQEREKVQNDGDQQSTVSDKAAAVTATEVPTGTTNTESKDDAGALADKPSTSTAGYARGTSPTPPLAPTDVPARSSTPPIKPVPTQPTPRVVSSPITFQQGSPGSSIGSAAGRTTQVQKIITVMRAAGDPASLTGIGIKFMKNIANGPFIITAIVPEGTAAQGGQLCPGDEIHAVAPQQGQEPVSVFDKGPDDVTKLILGMPGTRVLLHITPGSVSLNRTTQANQAEQAQINSLLLNQLQPLHPTSRSPNNNDPGEAVTVQRETPQQKAVTPEDEEPPRDGPIEALSSARSKDTLSLSQDDATTTIGETPRDPFTPRDPITPRDVSSTPRDVSAEVTGHNGSHVHISPRAVESKLTEASLNDERNRAFISNLTERVKDQVSQIEGLQLERRQLKRQVEDQERLLEKMRDDAEKQYHKFRAGLTQVRDEAKKDRERLGASVKEMQTKLTDITRQAQDSEMRRERAERLLEEERTKSKSTDRPSHERGEEGPSAGDLSSQVSSLDRELEVARRIATVRAMRIAVLEQKLGKRTDPPSSLSPIAPSSDASAAAVRAQAAAQAAADVVSARGLDSTKQVAMLERALSSLREEKEREANKLQSSLHKSAARVARLQHDNKRLQRLLEDKLIDDDDDDALLSKTAGWQHSRLSPSPTRADSPSPPRSTFGGRISPSLPVGYASRGMSPGSYVGSRNGSRATSPQPSSDLPRLSGTLSASATRTPRPASARPSPAPSQGVSSGVKGRSASVGRGRGRWSAGSRAAASSSSDEERDRATTELTVREEMAIRGPAGRARSVDARREVEADWVLLTGALYQKGVMGLFRRIEARASLTSEVRNTLGTAAKDTRRGLLVNGAPCFQLLTQTEGFRGFPGVVGDQWYLFFFKGDRWLIGPNLGVNDARMAVHDTRKDPREVRGVWMEYTGKEWTMSPDIQCSKPPDTHPDILAARNKGAA